MAEVSLPLPNKKTRNICALIIFSFFFELPLVEFTQYDRLNPRLFDLALILALFNVRWSINRANSVVLSWELLTATFVFSAIVSFALLVPIKYGLYSLFFGFKYIECLLALWILTGIQWTREDILYFLKAANLGIIVAGTWGFLQFLGYLPQERYLPTGEKIVTQEGVILATFGSTYFHSGFMGAAGAGICLLLMLKKAFPIYLTVPGVFFGLFLALFSGSRSALVMALIIIGSIVFRNTKHLVISVVCFFFLLLANPVIDYIKTNSLTFKRLEEGGASTVEGRISANYLDLVPIYWETHGAKLLAVGGGFYVVPLPNSSGELKYRIGYGLHNIHFFPLEQAGVLAFLFSIYFWFIVFKKCIENYRKNEFAPLGVGLAISIFIVGWFGQIFFFGFGTENMVVFQVIMIALLLHGSTETPKNNLLSKKYHNIRLFNFQ